MGLAGGARAWRLVAPSSQGRVITENDPQSKKVEIVFGDCKSVVTVFISGPLAASCVNFPRVFRLRFGWLAS